MSTAVGSQNVSSKETKSTTRNGITETVVTEVIQLPDGTVKTLRTTTTTGKTIVSHSNGHQEISQNTIIINKSANNDDEHRSNKLTSSFSKLFHINVNDKVKPKEIKSTNLHKHGSPKIHRASSSDSSDDDDEDFAETCLKWHNQYRAQHGVPSLTLSKTLNKYADEWAKKLAAEDSFRHRSDHKYGENIYMQWSSSSSFKLKGNAPVESWYSEIKDHKFGVDRPTSLNSGHFTQVVWKESRNLGVGKARSKSGKILVVCNYDPPGNLMGTYGSNVLPKCK